MRILVGLTAALVMVRFAAKAAFSFSIFGDVMETFPCASMRAPLFLSVSSAVRAMSPPE